MVDYDALFKAWEETINLWREDPDDIDVTEEVINEQRKRKEAAADQTDPVRSQEFDVAGLWSDSIRV